MVLNPQQLWKKNEKKNIFWWLLIKLEK